ncbi:type I restriction endonuclease subunit R [Ilyobacter polytropus]|uniref:Type I restriction enzyme endonuclease subunit n=1 Tax=Ilyobacter polytropus (strain ATCC 51220 / DSM 2926 / LMG 16218 / CuHBu1) TaxID=572544 RepID=E3HDZ4_ILYPC|nr:type I restriction endonuclease subunit R [Ilyobacter polytropus]ADO84606.1 type I site-specific deoxyribonuclease, HsdR family [Ilyobacter polytropus DSM 2926]
MCIQSEAALENKLLEQLKAQGYEQIHIKDEDELKSNFRKQLEKHNKIELSDREFSKVLIHLDGGSVFDKAKKLRDKFELKRDNDDIFYIEFFNCKDWCRNIFQISNQISMTGKYKNRYDVTILINGLPLVQIELKRSGIELKEAFNQINRYHKHSYRGLFNYVQLFVISNGVNTKYYANNKTQSFKQTFFWTDIENKRYSRLNEFAETFLDKCHLAKMISKYIVLHESDKILMALRPYQYFAVEKIVNRVENSPTKNGYIWHTTGSGKTLTSFKASQIITQNKNVDKVMFVVDRKDLDYQTIKEFDAFSKGSVNGTDDTGHLVKQLTDDKTKLIITTIQKLNNAISKGHLQRKMEVAKDKRMVFIFDECHRSQFGGTATTKGTHQKIKEFFSNKQFFGFTGTPIFAENSIKNKTTVDLFDECLHKYVIKDAINDDNVLGFSVEYYNTFKSHLTDEEGNDLPVDDIRVEGIDTREVFRAEERLDGVAEFIINNHARKTYGKEFTSIFAVDSVESLLKYYNIFKSKDHNLKIATIFSYQANEEDPDANGYTEEEEEKTGLHTRDKLDMIIKDYNETFGDNHDLNRENGFNAYYVDISKKVKDRKIDLLLVVNMFLTGFDSKSLNTLYVDKNLKHHGLIQAFSRTNRILNEKKKHGNIVCFRNLKKRTDEAITLFSNKDAIETVLMKPYEHYVEDFNKHILELYDIAPTVDSVDYLQSEDDKAKFVQAYRNLLRLMTRLFSFNEFSFDYLHMGRQTFEDYKSKYLDIYEYRKGDKEKVSILDELDFEVELIRRDDVNVAYIMTLLKDLDTGSASFVKDKEFILRTMEGSEDLRSKRELIEKFIEENLPHIDDGGDVESKFEEFLVAEEEREVDAFVAQENLHRSKVEETMEEYRYSNKMQRDFIKAAFIRKPPLKERKVKIPMIADKIREIIHKYTW